MADADGSSKPRSATSSSYACLALLGDRTMTASQVIEEMSTSGMRYLWPRAVSRLYEEPRHLCELGLAEVVGPKERGRGTCYRMTAAGQQALRDWLEVPGGPPSFEYEALLKVYCSTHGSREQLLLQLATMKDHIARGYAKLMKTSAQLAADGVAGPSARMSVLLFDYSRQELDMRARWVLETEREIARWPADKPGIDEPEAVQRWLLTRHQGVVESLQRFRAGEIPAEPTGAPA